MQKVLTLNRICDIIINVNSTLCAKTMCAVIIIITSHAGVAQLVEQRTCQNGLIGRTYIERCEVEVQVFFLAPVMRKSWVRVPSPAPLNRLLAQLVELPAHNRMVSGSSPGQPTKCIEVITNCHLCGCSSIGRAPDFQSGCCGFEPRHSLHNPFRVA